MRATGLVLMAVLAAGGASAQEAAGPGISRALARARARDLADIAYDVSFRFPADRAQPVEGRVRVGFEWSGDGPLVLDFADPRDRVRSVSVDGSPAGYALLDGHIVVPGSLLAQGHDEVEVTFVAGDGPLNRNPDFMYTLFVPDRAHEAFPCFDQPDLKARFTLELDLPASWKAVANGAEEDRTVNGDRAVHRFAQTRPLPTYLFAFAAGDWQVATATRHGRIMHMYYRESDSAKVARNTNAIFDLHDRALRWLEDYTGIPYPFGKFDFVLVPSFQYGGMEHPGAIYYRANSLMLDESATLNQELGRASVISHETSHMWFGDLVTMRWFNDVWMKEVFANFMAAKIVNPSFPAIDHELRFLLAYYPSAYEVDRTAGANPIRQDLENLDEAGSLYGAIIYQKAPIVMRQLEALVGPDSFRDGLRGYLKAHAYGNATWPDLIRVLDRRSDEDLAAWSHAWVEQPGRPTVTTTLTTSGGRIRDLALAQSDPWPQRDLAWNQQLTVALGYADSVAMIPAQLATPRLDVAQARGRPAPLWVLANGGTRGYGLFQPDSATMAYLETSAAKLPDARLRAVGWLTVWDAMLQRRIAPDTVMALAMDMLAGEPNELNAQRVLSDLADAYWHYIGEPDRLRWAARLEPFLWRRMEAAQRPRAKAAYFNAWRSIVQTRAGVARLRRIWSRQDSVPGLPLSEEDYTDLAFGLAIRGVPDQEAVLARQRGRIEDPDRRARFDFVMPALSADPAVRDSVFASLAKLENRRREPWSLAALGYLNHPLRAPRSERYIRPGLDLLAEIQRTGDIFFPKRWLDALLGGHRSPEAAAIVRRFLDEHPDYPARLRGKILQSADPLFRAAAMQE
ncbi:MAG TPA: M1 family aminopeptidase [Longimicrobiales bacterium]|nr:M1 family aminopeptidase [Longimicrobiales bacterium]